MLINNLRNYQLKINIFSKSFKVNAVIDQVLVNRCFHNNSDQLIKDLRLGRYLVQFLQVTLITIDRPTPDVRDVSR